MGEHTDRKEKIDRDGGGKDVRWKGKREAKGSQEGKEETTEERVEGPGGLNYIYWYVPPGNLSGQVTEGRQKGMKGGREGPSKR